MAIIGVTGALLGTVALLVLLVVALLAVGVLLLLICDRVRLARLQRGSAARWERLRAEDTRVPAIRRREALYAVQCARERATPGGSERRVTE